MKTLRRLKNVVRWKSKQDDCQELVKESIQINSELELDKIENLRKIEVNKDGELIIEERIEERCEREEEEDEIELDELIEKNDGKTKKQKRKEKRKRMRKRAWKLCRRTFKYLRIGFVQWANMSNFGLFPTDFRSYTNNLNKERSTYY